MTWMHDARDISRALAARAPELVRELLPAGVREGAEWRCGSIAGEKGRSLAVHLFGSKAGLWGDFAANQAGDALDLVAAVRFRGDKGAALKWAREWLGMPAEARNGRTKYLPRQPASTRRHAGGFIFAGPWHRFKAVRQATARAAL